MVRFKRIISYLCITAVLFAMAGCSSSPAAKIDEKNLPDISTVVIGPQLKTEPAGILVEQCAGAVIDYSSTSEGFVMMEYAGGGGNDIKAQVAGPETTYTYSLQNEKWAAFPLSEGDGEYTFTVFEDVGGGRYAMLVSVTAGVTLEDQFAPFIRPNQFVDYSDSPNAIAKAAQLAEGIDDTLEIVGRIFTYVITSLKYDTEKAQTVKSGYLPVLEETLETGKGICFDYAALMTGMLRSLGIPCKLVVGYAGADYHAWISVWSDDTGWIENVVYFNGSEWQFMDPTFASQGATEENYQAKYFY